MESKDRVKRWGGEDGGGLWDLYKNSPYKKAWGSTGMVVGLYMKIPPIKKAWGSTGMVVGLYMKIPLIKKSVGEYGDGGGTLYENSPYKKKRSLWLNAIALANYLKWNVI